MWHFPRSTSEGSVISCVHTLFSHGADSVDFLAFARALSRLPTSQTDLVPPVPVQLSEAAARRLISVKVYNDYKDSERKFVQLATDLDCTQSEMQSVLKVIKEERFQLEDFRLDFIRQVLFFECLLIPHNSTQFHIIPHPISSSCQGCSPRWHSM